MTHSHAISKKINGHCYDIIDCTIRQCLPLRRKILEYSIINPALSLLMKHLVIGQRQKAHNFSTFQWSSHGSLVSTGQHFVTTRVAHLPERTETCLITESDQIGPNHRIGSGYAWAVQSCYGCFSFLFVPLVNIKLTGNISIIHLIFSTG